MPKEKDLKIAKEVADGLRQKLGDEIIEVFLYGSRARGTAEEDSDMDIFLLMKERPHIGSREGSLIGDIVWDILDKYSIYSSVASVDLGQYNKWGDHLSIFRNIKKEGIKL